MIDFLKPDIWDGLVIAAVLIGIALAILRLISDRTVYKLEQELERRKAEQQAKETQQERKKGEN